MPVASHPRATAGSRGKAVEAARQGAIFLAPGMTDHADSCEPVRQAVTRGELRLHGFGRRSYPGIPLPARMLPEVSSIGFWDTVGAQNWGLDWHRDEGIELTYLAQCRIEAGKKRLRGSPSTSITEVALSCGFQSSQYFATVFHRRTGLSPTIPPPRRTPINRSA